MSQQVGFAPDEVSTAEPTRAARLKWVLAVLDTLPAGLAVNAAVCAASATSVAVAGLLGPEATDADGCAHPGLPWAGCTILAATAQQLIELRTNAAASPDMYVADMPSDAQLTRVYDEYLAAMSDKGAEVLEYYAVSIVGPRNRIDKLTKRLSLLP